MTTHSAPAATGDELVGGHDAAARLASSTGLKVRRWDIEVLAADGLLPIHSCYHNNPLYRHGAIDAVTIDQLKPVVDARLAWFSQSIRIEDAPDYLGVTLQEFIELGQHHGFTTDAYRRIPIAELQPLRRNARSAIPGSHAG